MMGAYAKREPKFHRKKAKRADGKLIQIFQFWENVILGNWARNHSFVVHFSSGLGQAVSKLGEKIFMCSALPV